MDSLLQDLRYAARTLLRSRGFALTAVLCLALGIAANTAVFSLVNALLLRPPPYPEADRLVFLVGERPRQGVTDTGVSYPDLADWRASVRAFEDVAARAERSFTLTGTDLPERIQGSAVTPNLFRLVGVQPQLGRGFLDEEGAPSGFEPSVILSDRLWRRRYGADPAIVGKPVPVNGRELVVVGVMPPDFEFPEDDELWVPFGPRETEPRDARYLSGVALLREGVALPEAQAELAAAAEALAARHPDTNRDWSGRVMTFHERMIGGASQGLLAVMLGAVGFVLLIACANVANLLLARAGTRRREISVRAALGASRARVVRQLLTESLVLALVAGALGTLLGAWWLDAMVAGIPERIPDWARIEVDRSVLLYTLGISVATGLLFGAAPAWRAARTDLQSSLRDGGRGVAGGARQGRLRGALVVGEIALSLVLLVGAALMIRSFLALHDADAGFRTERMVTMRLYVAGDRYDPVAVRAAYFQRAVESIATLPGVEAVVATSSIPTDDGGAKQVLTAEGQPVAPGEELTVSVVGSTPGLLGTLGTPLLAGRDFTWREAADSAATTVVVGAGLAERLWPGADPLGRRVRLGTRPDNPWLTVVGVAPDVQYEEFGEETPQSRLQLHVPYALMANRQMAILARVRSEPEAVAGAMRTSLLALDGTLPTFDVRTMEEVRIETIWPQRLFGSVFAAFALIALVLAASGVYGVVSYGVSQRVHEIGVRLALGASAGDVLRLVVGQGARLALLGVAAGVPGAFLTSRLLAASLYGVRALDPLAFSAVPLALATVALLASWLPARRATRVDPAVALRAE